MAPQEPDKKDRIRDLSLTYAGKLGEITGNIDHVNLDLTSGERSGSKRVEVDIDGTDKEHYDLKLSESLLPENLKRETEFERLPKKRSRIIFPFFTIIAMIVIVASNLSLISTRGQPLPLNVTVMLLVNSVLATGSTIGMGLFYSRVKKAEVSE
jgi:hypothetical protein